MDIIEPLFFEKLALYLRIQILYNGMKDNPMSAGEILGKKVYSEDRLHR